MIMENYYKSFGDFMYMFGNIYDIRRLLYHITQIKQFQYLHYVKI